MPPAWPRSNRNDVIVTGAHSRPLFSDNKQNRLDGKVRPKVRAYMGLWYPSTGLILHQQMSQQQPP